MNFSFLLFGENLIGRKILNNLIHNNAKPQQVVQEISNRKLFTQVYRKLYDEYPEPEDLTIDQNQPNEYFILNNSYSEESRHKKRPKTIQQLCQEYEIEHHVIKNMNSKKSQRILKDTDVILLGGSRILIDDIHNCSKYGVINMHSGLLPTIKGANAAIWSIYLDQPLGCTSHFIDSTLDGGRIIIRDHVSVYRGETLEDIYWKVTDQMGETALKSIQLAYEQGFENVKTIPNNFQEGDIIHGVPTPDVVAKAQQMLKDQTYSHYED